MPRIKRKQIKFDEESANSLLQEIYNDSHNIRAKITMLFRKWEKYVDDETKIAILGEQIVKLIQAEAKNQDQKIMLLKFLKEVAYKETPNKENNQSETSGNISNERKNALLSLVKDKLDGKN